VLSPVYPSPPPPGVRPALVFFGVVLGCARTTSNTGKTYTSARPVSNWLAKEVSTGDIVVMYLDVSVN